MPTITIEVPKKKELDILEYLSSFDYIKIRDRKKLQNKYKNKLIDSLKEVESIENKKSEKDSVSDSELAEIIKEIHNK